MSGFAVADETKLLVSGLSRLGFIVDCRCDGRDGDHPRRMQVNPVPYAVGSTALRSIGASKS